MTTSGSRYATPFATLDAVRDRSLEAVIGQSGIQHPDLIKAIRHVLSSRDSGEGALVRTPVIEGAFPYIPGDRTLAELSGELVDPRVVDALTTNAPGRRYVFPRDLKPYRHQLEAWTVLGEAPPRSLMVTSGTGSGKTECFLVPLLDDLAREAQASGRLSGVRAIALYPLNALIASQEERLREWTAPFDGHIRFGLYNGDMPPDDSDRHGTPEQVKDRRTLRADPPPILVTNVTMLEYMTVRKEDRPLIEASRGKLRWIILDEAHSYIGSAAAEIALLIRRVLLAFGVTSKDVRFVATSATIGEGEDTRGKLKRFLADVAGLPEASVDIVVGERVRRELPQPSPVPTLSEADLADPARVAAAPSVQALVRELENGPISFARLEQAARKADVTAEALAGALTAERPGVEPLAPLRVHGFLRAVPGLWACLNEACPQSPRGAWPFGAVLPEHVDECPHCHSATIEIVACRECGEPFLDAIERGGRLLQPRSVPETDEFAAGLEVDAAVPDDEENAEQVVAPAQAPGPDIPRLFAARKLPRARPLHVAAHAGIVCDAPTEDTRTFNTHDRTIPESCPACAARAREEDASGALLRPFRFGAPFLLGNAVPVLLDGVTPRASGDEPIPAEGRQLLSFTDSRQGTARFAASIQSAAERNLVRARVYFAVQETLMARDDPATREQKAQLEGEIAGLRPLADQYPVVASVLREKELELKALTDPPATGLPWPKLRENLAAQVEIGGWMREVWASRDPRFGNSPVAFTQFLLLRELARRPRRANALETLGLARLRFAAIDALPEIRRPIALQEHNLGIADWRDFLHLLITNSLRANFAIRMERDDVRWLIRNGYPRIILLPGAERVQGSLSWPRARARGRQSNVVRLLERVLRLDARSDEDRAELNAVLDSAWHDLSTVLQQPGAGLRYAVDFDTAHVAPVTRAALCPVTRRLIDTTFASLSPYGLDGSSQVAGTPCRTFDMPRHPNPFLKPERGGAESVDEWLASDGAIHELRAAGLWTDLHDRIAQGSPYMRAAEHSAQQPSRRLRRYEDDFKAGKINVLNCSTTMEMGVDIGSVSSVMMTNVPPSIANYRQRVGRAGRRGQGFSTALTYARDTPLDRETFRDPLAYLARRIEAPRVSLDSRRIAQRHVNALLLASWFGEAEGEALKAKAGDFFGCPPGVGAKREAGAPSRLFCEWARSPSTAQSLQTQVAALTQGSAIDGDEGMFDTAAAAVELAEKAFVVEWDAIQALAADMKRDAARKSLGFQLKRMCGEYLLGELADRGVLPGHGFPTAVVPFVNTDKEDDDEAPGGSDRGENRFRRRSFPTRNLDVAIRDYAPGAEVVVDGLVHKSAGVTLNWRRPAGADNVAEIQSLKWFWQCSRCGAADVARIRPETCAACASPLGSEDVRRFLEPAGFTVDLAEEPHAEIERVSYVEPEPERVAARGAAWTPFLDPTRGRIRASSEGLVFHSSRGGKRRLGYAVCLACGRAEAQSGPIIENTRPLADHRPLRFTKADEAGLCPGNHRSFAVQEHLALGHDVTTDVVEVQIAALDDEAGAWAVASALREALARLLGVEAGEMGLSVARREALARLLGVEAGEMGLSVARRESAIGGGAFSIFLFDRAAGGAGFAPRLREMFAETLNVAAGILDCKQPGCVRGCSGCVVTRDLYDRADTLDRRVALEVVRAEIAACGSPDEADRARADAVLARDAADEIAATTAPDDVVIWAGSPFDPAALAEPRLRRLLESLSTRGRTTTLCIAPEILAGLDAAQRLGLRDAAIRYGLRIAEQDAPTFPNGARALAGLRRGPIWASRDAEAAILGPRWGVPRQAALVRVPGETLAPGPIDLNSLLPNPGVHFLEVCSELDGASRSLGTRLVEFIRLPLEELGLWRAGRLVAIHYSDRYVHSPIAADLVLSAAQGLAGALGRGGQTALRIATAPLRQDDDRPPWRVTHNWRDEDDRAGAMTHAASARGLDLTLDVGACPHSRKLKLVFDDGEAQIILDQGFGFLRPARAQNFDFREEPAGQGKRLAALNALCAAENASYMVLL